MDPRLAEEVRRRAKDACEYCRMPQAFYKFRFPADHIIARQHGGTSTMDNLAFCCTFCNRHKGPNIAGIDPITRMLVPLFNPRCDAWAEHFEWRGPELIGKTPIGNATIMVLAINDPDFVAVRRALILEGNFPPEW